MASIEEVRAGIAAANEHANSALGAVNQAINEMEDALGTLMHAVDGSGQADATHSVASWAKAKDNLEEVRQQISAGISMAEELAGRL